MSRIGKQVINIPSAVNLSIKDQYIEVKGPKGVLSREISPLIHLDLEENTLKVLNKNNTLLSQQQHGLTRTLIANMVEGTSKGFEKKLVIVGVGYRANMDGLDLMLNVGYSHPVKIVPPEGITIRVENNTNIFISGADKQLIGEVAATIRAKRPPEPYKGKGIRYENEVVKLKAGKAKKGK
uniref:Large ribosomal subunit protein uL6c n=1 Tax=Bulboplastis apyrenoidosa TaxID=1070855 RepID=A0A1Y9TM95_9RHOD|nr:50S ribosomal protein L6 [Bulboplastis apyrenoidosa]ARO90770.1 50S ribosomal protein L6 [Bulboplastis apyrenoidosa]